MPNGSEFTYHGYKYKIESTLDDFGFDLEECYYLTVLKNGKYVGVYNKVDNGVNFFKTIKEAQRYVMNQDCHFFTM